MHDVLSLVRIYFKGVKPLSQMLGAKKKIGKIGMGILMAYGFSVIAVMMGFTYYAYAAQSMEAGFLVASVTTFLFIFLASLLSVPSLFVTARDMPFVLSLPVDPWDIVLSRFLIGFLGYLPFGLFLYVPMVVVQCILSSFSFLSLLSSILSMLLIVLSAFSLATILSACFSRLAGIGKRSRAGKAFLSLSIVLIVLFSSRMVVRFSEGTLSSTQLASQITTWYTLFSPFLLYARSVSSLPWFLLSAVISLLLSLTAIALEKKWFWIFRSSLRNSVTKRKKRMESAQNRSPEKALFDREFIIMKSEGLFMTQIVMELCIPILLFVIYAFMGVLTDMTDSFSSLLSPQQTMFVVFLVIALFMTMSSLSSTSVSREGKHFAEDALYPVPPKEFLRAKVRFHLCLGFPVSLLYLVISVLACGFPFLHLLWMAPLLFLTLLTSSLYALAIDYRRPNLEWTLPQQAIKSNFNVFLSMLLSLLLLGLDALCFFLVRNPVLSICLSYAVTLCAAFFSWRLAGKSASLGLGGR
jgi:ABC-2 type transport system permease protein